MTDLSVVSAPEARSEVSSGWKARIELTYAHRYAKTRLVRCQRQGPLSVQRAFYPENDVCHTYLLHPPGGVVGSDQLDVHVQVEEKAHTLITTPGATKFYRSGGRLATYRQHLHLAAGACLEWFPQENIFFPDSQVRMSTQINLHPDSRFIGWEIMCLGRPVIHERFTQGQLMASTQLLVDGAPLLIEHLLSEGDSQQSSLAGMHGYPMQATMLLYPASEALLSSVQALMQNETHLISAVTLLDSLLVVRVLGHQTEALMALLTRVWSEVRPDIIGKPACIPRIWAT
ncbi:urease accessory protein UreD [Nitrincola nitratireducens]|uniref:Urease accessory protein UreD n=1 Tax=Nitrincola nitratireducens TaxID=1229521 RepID=W9UUW1_9GAMM|nr:urease accessory protein UreD [Nitrincola nitratireducens]EXJ11038.1 Urease accessory protein UreD [Nitrincola nitratireducens]